jgi:ferredoxin
VYAADELGRAVVLREEFSEDLREKAVLGMQGCPESAISIED